MNEMQVFQNSEFGELGVLEVNGKPYFPATACAKILGYANPWKAINDHCKKDGLTKREVIDSMGRTQSAKFINEGNLYRLIVHSKLPAAERFEKWVFDEVLPTIRQTGGYGSQTAGLTKLAEQMAQAATAMVQVASALTTVVDKLTDMVDRMSGCPAPSEADLEVPRLSYLARTGEQPPTMTDAWRANYHPGPRKKVVARMPGNGMLRMETFPPEILGAVNSMMEQMVEEQTLNFSEIARYCNKMGCTISSPSVRRYYDKHFNN